MSQIKRKKSIIEFLISKKCPLCYTTHIPDSCIYCNNYSPECSNCINIHVTNLKNEYISYYKNMFSMEIDIPHHDDLKKLTCYYDDIIEQLLDSITVCKECI